MAAPRQPGIPNSQWARDAHLGPPPRPDTDPVVDESRDTREIGTGLTVVELRTKLDHTQRYCARLESELKSLQEATGAVASVTAAAAGDENVTPWVTNVEALSPLLSCYDARIAELDAENKRLVTQLSSQREGFENLIAENTNLRDELEQAAQKLEKQAREGVAGFWGGAVSAEGLSELEEQLAASNQECRLLQEQVATMNQEIEQFRRSDAEKDRHILQVTQKHNMMAAQFQRLQEEYRRLQADKQTAETSVLQHAGNLTDVKGHVERLTGDLKSEKARTAKLQSLLEEHKIALKELHQHAESERDALDAAVHAAATRARELQAALDEKSRECYALKEQLRAANRSYEAVRQDAENMMKIMQAHERRLADYAAREGKWEDTERQCAEKVEEALLQRDQAQAKETQCRREIARLLDQRRTDAGEAARQQQEAVNAMRARLLEQLHMRDQELRRIITKSSDLQAAADRADRDRRSAEANVERVMEAAREEQAKLHDELSAQIEARRMLEAERDNLSNSLKSAQADNSNQYQRWKVTREQLEVDKKTLTMERDEFQVKLRSTEAQLRELANQKRALEAVLERERLQARDALEASQQKVDKTIHETTQQLAAADERLKDQQAVIDELSSQLQTVEAAKARLMDDYQQEATTVRRRLEGNLQELEDQNAKVLARNEELARQLADSIRQIQEVNGAKQEIELRLRQLQARIVDTEKRLTDGGLQLSQAYAARDQQIQDMQRVRADLERTKLSEQRAQRKVQQLERVLEETRSQTLLLTDAPDTRTLAV